MRATFSPRCYPNVTVGSRRCGTLRSSDRVHRAISWLRPLGSRGDHGMNQRFRPLTCLCALAMLTAFSSDAVAAARHKQTHQAKKPDAGHKQAGHKRYAAHKKGKHAAAARRKSTKSTDAPA